MEDFHDIPANDPLVAANTDNVNETPALEDSLQYLSNVYDLLEGFGEFATLGPDQLDIAGVERVEIGINEFRQNDAFDSDIDTMVDEEDERQEAMEEAIEELADNDINSVLVVEEEGEKLVEQVIEVKDKFIDNDTDGVAVVKRKKEKEQMIETTEESEVREKDEYVIVISLKLKHKNQECDKLGKSVFDWSQQIKISSDRIAYLENNNFRTQVVKKLLKKRKELLKS